MPRYAAFLRGVMPQNAKMSELRALLESLDFTDVKSILASGNLVFSTKATPVAKLEKLIEAAMQKQLGRVFLTIVRPVDQIEKILEADPYRAFKLKSGSKRVVTFLRGRPKAKVSLPIELDGARILKAEGTTVYSAYVVSPKGPVFMKLIESTFGKDVTTRTWDTLGKIARA